MMVPSFILWDVGSSVYTYGSLFIIALIIWHVRRSHRGLRLGPIKSCTKTGLAPSRRKCATTPVLRSILPHLQCHGSGNSAVAGG
ncbi:cDNA sequence BC049635, isoform CRA_a [Mus musculus]|nr:cDNA sequence BC049635, isoform CRA_a [Mus musculus]